MTFPSVFATGTLAGIEPSDTQILTGDGLPQVSLEDIQQHLRKSPSTQDDAELSTYLAAARNKIRSICVALAPVTVQDTFDGNGASVLMLSTYPVTGITSVTVYASDGTSTALSEAGGATGNLDGWRKDLSAGTLTRVGIRSWPAGWGNIVVQYAAGPSSTPPEVVQAVKHVVQVWWDSRRLAGNLRQPGGQQQEPADVRDPVFGIPDETYDLLQDWLKPPRVA